MIAHMLKTLNGHNTIKHIFRRKINNIGSDDMYIAEATPLRFCADELTLTMRVGHRRNRRLWVGCCHKQREGAPPTTNFENRLAIVKVGTLARQRQHIGLSLAKVGDPLGKITTTVLAMRAQNHVIKRRWHFIMLMICRLRFHRDGRCEQGFH